MSKDNGLFCINSSCIRGGSYPSSVLGVDTRRALLVQERNATCHDESDVNQGKDGEDSESFLGMVRRLRNIAVTMYNIATRKKPPNAMPFTGCNILYEYL